MMKDSEIMSRTGFKVPQSDEKIKSSLDKWISEGSLSLSVWALEEKKSQKLAGWFMLKKTTEDYPELGYMIQKEFWGKGYATEASLSLLDYALCLGFKKVMATTSKENQASIRVLEKSGMIRKEMTDNNIVIFEKVLNEKN